MEDLKLQKLHKVMKSMLDDVVLICEKYNIRYYLDGGSLLGAIRHQGFIPWDNDIDIMMPYRSYKRFLKIAQEELGDSYFVQNSDTDPCWNRAYTTIRKNNTTMMFANNTHFHAHQGIFLDVFPITFFKNTFDYKFKKRIISLSNYIIMDDFYYANYDLLELERNKWGMLCLKIFQMIPFGLRRKLHKSLVEFVINKSPKGRRYFSTVWCTISPLQSKNCLEGKRSIISFEGNQYYSVPDYDLYLTTLYGDYMTPVRMDKGLDNMIIDFDNSWTEYLKE